MKYEVEFENREKQHQMFFSQKWDYQDSEKRNKINDLSLQKYFTFAKFSIEISCDEFKVVMAETYKFDYRAETIRTALFSNFGLTRIWSMDQNRKFVNTIFLYKGKLFDEDFVWNIEIASYWEIGVWLCKKLKTTNVFVVSDYRDRDGSSKVLAFQSNHLPKTSNFR